MTRPQRSLLPGLSREPGKGQYGEASGSVISSAVSVPSRSRYALCSKEMLWRARQSDGYRVPDVFLREWIEVNIDALWQANKPRAYPAFRNNSYRSARKSRFGR